MPPEKNCSSSACIFMPHVCVVPCTHFCVQGKWTWPVSYHFDDLNSSQYTLILECYRINPFQSIPHSFFHNTIAWKELDFILMHGRWCWIHAGMVNGQIDTQIKKFIKWIQTISIVNKLTMLKPCTVQQIKKKTNRQVEWRESEA